MKAQTARNIAHLKAAILQTQDAEKALVRAHQEQSTRAAALRGELPVRELARTSGLSPATISNFLRGWQVVASDTALHLVECAAALLPSLSSER